MISRIHQMLGTAGFVISIVALVAALGGGAYAASGGLSGKQKKEVEKIAKKYAGKPGAAGAAGAKGDTGTPGTPGTSGANGTDGKNGTAGRSISLAEIPSGKAECAGDGGAVLTEQGSTSSVEICNGEEGARGATGATGATGAQGPEGALGTAGTTLPPGASETGVWSLGSVGEGMVAPGADPLEQLGHPFRVPISFMVPLTAGLEGTQVHYIVQGGTAPSECAGGTAEHPTAEPGNLCIYTAEEAEPTTWVGPSITDPSKQGSPEGASAYGAALQFILLNPGGQAYGTWAVTASAAQ